MSESETTEITKNESSPRKRVRPRKKKLYENVLKQMEFYFSDANLSKDRFLAELIKNDPYVPIETFNKFNKIRSMTTDVSVIANALKNSTSLELSEDKLKIKRKIPLLPYDVDLRTVYVESIPVTATLEWLSKVFSEFGKVAYISLPKFKTSQKIKGFGFIEFSKPEEAQKCTSAFTKMGCKLPTHMPPEELSSIKVFSVEDSVAESPVKKDENTEEHEPPKKKTKKHKDKKPLKNLDLKLNSESDCEKKVETPEDNKCIATTLTDYIGVQGGLNALGIVSRPLDDFKNLEEQKKIDREIKEETNHDVVAKQELIRQDVDIKEESDSHDNMKIESEEDIMRKKKARKKLSKDKSKAKNTLDKNEASPGALWGLQVLPKSEWKYLRNKYLNLQRKYMKEIKNKLHNNKVDYSSIPAPAAPSVDDKRAMHAATQAPKSSDDFEKIPGVFVKEVLTEPCLDVRLTKRAIRCNIHVLHVDVKEGQQEAVLRFDSPKSAEEYCARTNRAHVLRGDEEEQQWAIVDSWRALRRMRGRSKLLAKNAMQETDLVSAAAPASPQPTNTHIRFDE